MLLLDVTPHSLGIMIVGGYFHKLDRAEHHGADAGVAHLHHRQGQPDLGEDPRAPGRERSRRGERAARRVRADRPAARAARRGRDRGARSRSPPTASSSVTAQGPRDRPRAVDHRDRDLGPDRGRDHARWSSETKDYLLEVRRRRPGVREVHASSAEKLIDEIEALFPRSRRRSPAATSGRTRSRRRAASIDRARQGIAEPRSAGCERLDRGADAHPEHVQGRRLQDARRMTRWDRCRAKEI